MKEKKLDEETGISVTGMKIFSYEHPSLGYRDETSFNKVASLSQNTDQNRIVLVLVEILEVYDLALLVKSAVTTRR